MSTVKCRPIRAPNDPVFAAAADHRRLVAAIRPVVRESRPVSAISFSERHLQSVWFDPAYRPAPLLTTEGETVIVRSPGRWNLEAGPDFLDAQLLVGPRQRTLRGDVEVHVRPEEWTRHGHGLDPRYRNVIAHVTYRHGRLPTGSLPPGAVEVPLQAALDADPAFYFEAIDTTAYPYAVPASPYGARKPVLADQSPEQIDRILLAAGEERLRLKTAHMVERIERQGAGQALYEGVTTALGYKHNRGACRRLAGRVPLDRLRDVSGGDPVHAHALLAGVAGLLPDTPRSRWDAETRRYVRRQWDFWWRVQSQWAAEDMPRGVWRVAGVRPQNHPTRRLAAVAALFAGQPAFEQRLLALDIDSPACWLKNTARLLAPDAEVDYWGRRFTFGGAVRPKAVALIGDSRRAAILVNVFIPFVSAQGRDVRAVLDALPASESNQIIRQTAHALFGPDHNPAVYAGAIRQQGMMQIFHDFCLPDRLDALGDAVTREAG
jgi:hypothetical protein